MLNAKRHLEFIYMNEVTKKLVTIVSDTLEKIGEVLSKSVSDSEGKKISHNKIDENQLIYYNLAYHNAESAVSRSFYNYAINKELGCSEMEETMALLFAGEALSHLRGELSSHPDEYGLDGDYLNSLFNQETNQMIQNSLAYKHYDSVAEKCFEGRFGSLAISKDYETVRETFREFSEKVVAPRAERVHRNDEFIPDEILSGLIEMGAFGVTIPGKYGGYLDDYGTVGMMLITEELSRGGLSIAGSLITRPEILSKALLKGGTNEQKSTWLPALASGKKLNAVAVTEPNYGSDVSGMEVTANKTASGWLINGIKTWCTFAGYADVIMLLARSEKDPSLKHKGLSIFLVEKPRHQGHKFETVQEKGGKLTGSAISTIGYRGMHSFELSFENYFVPDDNLLGGENGRGKGFYTQMAGFSGGRVQTAARANGVMQAAMEAACRYAGERKVFGKKIGYYQLTRWKIARMAMITQASRQYSLAVSRMIDEGKGEPESTLIKFYAARISEWVTREAMQIHGGMGYAEEYAVSRYYLDARVFSIFEGAEEVMALRVCAKNILSKYLTAS